MAVIGDLEGKDVTGERVVGAIEGLPGLTVGQSVVGAAVVGGLVGNSDGLPLGAFVTGDPLGDPGDTVGLVVVGRKVLGLALVVP